MKITTINFKERIEKSKIKKSFLDKTILLVLLVSQIFINTLIPFIFGFYYCYTKSFIFLLLIFVSIIFNIQIETKKDGDIKIKVLRNV